MTKKTKIVATIGPATESEEVIEQLINAGMNVARFNTKHNEPSWHSAVMERVHAVAKRLNKPVATLLDLQGPEIRINLPREEAFDVAKGSTVVFASEANFPQDHFIIVPPMVIDSLMVGHEILLDDGACEFVVTEKQATSLTATAKVDSKVKHRKTMNTPGVVLNMPSLTERDYTYLRGVNPDMIDMVGLSFVRNAEDIEILRTEMGKFKIDASIVAKIENQAACDNIEEIVDVADVVMVARGDLGVEVPYEQLIFWQKMIIDLCRSNARPVITATQMLKSMMENPRPTRAEVSDVAHAIYDGTDAVMLSDETTIGKYPVKAVETQATIAQFNEPYARHQLQKSTLLNTDTSSAISHAAFGLITDSQFNVDKIVILTETGSTARLIARFRLKTPIFAITSNEKTMRKLAVTYGINPYMIQLPEKKITQLDKIIAMLSERGVLSKGETVMFIHGRFWKTPGLTNTITVETIE